MSVAGSPVGKGSSEWIQPGIMREAVCFLQQLRQFRGRPLPLLLDLVRQFDDGNRHGSLRVKRCAMVGKEPRMGNLKQNRNSKIRRLPKTFAYANRILKVVSI